MLEMESLPVDPNLPETPDGTTTVVGEQRDSVPLPPGCIGRVAAPPLREATSEEFYFWVPRTVLVERTQLVTCTSVIAGAAYRFFAVVTQVYRASRKRNMMHEVNEADGDLAYMPPYADEGYTYAVATILRSDPPALTSPLERSSVTLATDDEARTAYGADEIEHALAIGLIKNGGAALAGRGVIDLDYLLGVNGGHMNVNGSAGRGTKSSFLLHVNWLLLREAKRQQRNTPSAPGRLRVVPIILNVKGFDLFHIDRPNRRYKPAEHHADWAALGHPDPAPFADAVFFAAQQHGSDVAIATGRAGVVQPYSWSLRDAIEGGLLPYLFADVDTDDANFGALVLDIEAYLTSETPESNGGTQRRLRTGDGRPETFTALRTWIDDQANMKDDLRALRNHHNATWKRLHRRLLRLLYDGRGVLRLDDQTGHPLQLVRADTCGPLVVDLAALAGKPDLQRFVVATVLRQLVAARTGTNAINGLIYLVTLDELNRFAPRGAHDPITQLVETVAAEMRSQGIILLGAQQQASKVSEKVIENAAIRVLGRSGSLELAAPVWRSLSDSARGLAVSLAPNEKLILQDCFREPMHLRVPFPVWAMNPNEVTGSSPTSNPHQEQILDG